MGATIAEFARRCLNSPNALLGNDPRAVFQDFGATAAMLCLPGALIASVVSTAFGFAQAGFQPHLDLAAPKWSRLEPLSKLQHMFSPREGAMNLAISMARVTAIGAVTYSVLRSELPGLTVLARADLDAGMSEVVNVALRLSLWSTSALAVLAGIEYGKSYWQTEQSLKMTRQEVKDEMHQQEGDPKVKMRIRARAREIVRRGVAKEVKTADVVVTNPTHVAVALRYRRDEGAPVVAAKGYDDVAQYIKKLAREYDIPQVENVPLARELAKRVKAGKAIPVDLYTAVAEVLAFVYRLRGRGIRA
jgi:flagellar biosynthetic protein FlhB